ncbi:MAG: sigma-70 family RNA polymerase sigma factor, partial [Kofleriaceae bacterium]
MQPAAAIADVFRAERTRVLATTIRVCNGDFELAEEAVQEAFAAALLRWPSEGTPTEPRGWLVTVARHKAIDQIRRRSRLREIVGAEASPELYEPEPQAVQDDRLRLIFTCCHPALAPEAQVALTLRTLGGLTTEEIARAFLTSPVTMAQRLVRAKTKIRDAGIPYAVPEASELAERTAAAMAVIYLIFNEGYAATAGDEWLRKDLCNEAIRLGRLVVELLGELLDANEPRGLLALMLLHDARRDTRTDDTGDVVLLEDQDRARWDHAQIAEALELVPRALRNGAGPYALEAAIAALHCSAAR